jgi:hypothetical protein
VHLVLRRHAVRLGLVWEPQNRRGQNRRGYEELESISYSKLNKKGILAPPITFGFVASKLDLRFFRERCRSVVHCGLWWLIRRFVSFHVVSWLDLIV